MAHEDSEQPMDSTAVSASQMGQFALEDETLVAAAREGDYAAFERLFDRHRVTVFRFAYQMTQRRDEAEDIAQEAFVRAFQSLYRFRKEAKFTTWILRITSNLCTDRARMIKRRSALEHQEAAGQLEWMTSGRSVNPVDELERDRRADVVRRAVRALPSHHRGVLIMRDFEEREYIDIAEILNCSVGGAKLRVLRARRALRDRLGPLLSDWEQKTG
ncbi:MAG: RNA polymerase sigma factor [Armatimonadetes bacterium]|nr:RNA polymerase sigma factor [Armatimonadota bacterium]